MTLRSTSPIRHLAVLLVLLLALMGAHPPALSVAQTGPIEVQRVGGADRYETAVLTVLEAHYDRCDRRWEAIAASLEECRDEGSLGSPDVVRGDSFADALGAATLQGGPILTTPRDGLPPAWERLRGRLGREAIVIGEEDVVSDSVAQDLVAGFVEGVSRVGGPSRYDTALAVAELHRQLYDPARSEGVVVVNGESWPDALAAGGLAEINIEVLAVQQDAVPTPVLDFIERTNRGLPITIVGGTNAISEQVENQLNAIPNGGPVRRLAGATRIETAQAVAEVHLAEGSVPLGRDGNPVTGVLLIRPDTFADAIAAPNLIRSRGAPILIAATNTDLGQSNADWLAANGTDFTSITALGTPDVLADTVLDQALDAVCTNRTDC